MLFVLAVYRASFHSISSCVVGNCSPFLTLTTSAAFSPRQGEMVVELESGGIILFGGINWETNTHYRGKEKSQKQLQQKIRRRMTSNR